MNYLYHIVPKDLRGTVLYPLNDLKNHFPDLYEKQAAVYKGREHDMQMRIPTLGCLWNDVLHFAAVHPREIKQALIEAGHIINFQFRCYEVDPHLLLSENTTVFLFKPEYADDLMNKENFASYDPDEVEKYSSVTQMTNDYYREAALADRMPLAFRGIPHILFKGELDIGRCKIVVV